MALTVLTAANPVASQRPRTTPYSLVLAIDDDGGGGTVTFNAAGENSGANVDLPTFFGGTPAAQLLQPLKRRFATAAEAVQFVIDHVDLLTQFASGLSTAVWPAAVPASLAVGSEFAPAITYSRAADVACVFRLTMSFRHSLVR